MTVASLLLLQAKRPRTSTASDTKTTTEATEAKVGFDFGDELENILGIQRSKDGFLCAYVSWYAVTRTFTSFIFIAKTAFLTISMVSSCPGWGRTIAPTCPRN